MGDLESRGCEATLGFISSILRIRVWQTAAGGAMMSRKLFSFKVLVGLVVVNIATTIAHYVDNIAFFGEYPEPTWLAPGMVDAFWFLMTPVAFVGLWLAHRRRIGAGSIALLVYAGMSLLVLGHYRFAPFDSIGWRIHTLIWLEAAAALLLIFWLLASWLTAGDPIVEP